MASFIESIFGKAREKVTLEDVEGFFTEPKEETSTLEFKSGNISQDKLFKSVTGLLNAEGGLLIIGSPEEREKDKEDKKHKYRIKFAVGELVPCTNLKTRESINQLLGSHIVPPPAGIKILPFEKGDGYIYLIEVPQSVSPPHQVTGAGTGIYYFRNDNTTVPASHGVVSALFNQRRVPRLYASIGFEYQKDKPYLDFNILLTNESEYPADKVGYMISFLNVFDIFGNIKLNFTENKHTEFNIRERKAVFTPDTVIPKGLGERKIIRVAHSYGHILVYVLHWSVQNTTRGAYSWIDCATGKIVDSTNEVSEGETFLNKFFDFLKEDPNKRIVAPFIPPGLNMSFLK
jgi:hypothetical protein